MMVSLYAQRFLSLQPTAPASPTAPTSVKARPARRRLYQGVAVFGITPAVIVVVVGVTAGVGVGVGGGVGGGVGVGAQIPLVMVLVSSVTAPSRANNCPSTVAPVVAVMDANAKMCPTK